MGRKRSPGLRNRGGIWHIEKQVLGQTIHESTGTSDLKTAELILARRIEEIRQAKQFGVRPRRTFREAATKFLEENIHLASIGDYAMHLKQLDPFIGDLPLQNVHLGTLQPFIEARRKQGIKTKSINLALGCVRRILNLAARLWRDENGLTWLETAPLIQMLPVTDARRPYPLSWEEQHKLFQALPDHLARMCLFKVNTGCREQEVCQLRWDWEVRVPELDTSVFIVPGEVVKNREDRLMVLNRIARSVIEEVRGKHSEYVFTYRGHPVNNINNTSWKRARILAAMDAVRSDPECAWITDSVECEGTDIRAEVQCQRSDSEEPLVLTYTREDYEQERAVMGRKPLTTWQKKDPDLRQQLRHKAIQRFLEIHWPSATALSRVRVHDLKHTFGRRLRAAGVPVETRKVLLGHRNGDITTHYSAPELKELLDAAGKVCGEKSGKTPALVVLKTKAATADAVTA